MAIRNLECRLFGVNKYVVIPLKKETVLLCTLCTWSQIRTDSANIAEPDQTPHSTVSDKVLYSSVCLQNVILKFERNGKLLPKNPCFRFGSVQLIRAKTPLLINVLKLATR